MRRKGKKWTKPMAQLMALCLTLLITVGMFATTAFAETIVQNNGSIAVTGVEDGVTVSAYQVLTVKFDYDQQQPVAPVYFWNEAVKSWISANYPDYIKTEDGSVTEAFSAQSTAEEMATFYDALAAAIKGGEVKLSANGSCTGNGVIESLPMGGYLIFVENGLKVYRPSAVNIVPQYEENAWVMKASQLVVKSSDMTLDKTINETEKDHNKDVSDQGSIGETVHFDLRADVPQYPAKAVAKQYYISDTLSAGLTLTEDSIEVYGVKDDAETKLDQSVAYTIGNARPNEKGSSTFTLTFVYDQIQSYEKIHVKYSAVINQNAVVGEAGNPNHAYLDYNNNPYDDSSWSEIPDEVKVYTYGLKVTKVNEEKEKLTGAEFILSESEDGSNPLLFVQTEEGVYRLATAADTNAAQMLKVGETGDIQGMLTISGLSTGTYYLTETKAPGGYNKLSSPVTVEIKDDNLNGKPTIGNDTQEFEDGYGAMNVINTQGFELPTTGGMGTFLFTAGGIIIMGTAIVLLILFHKKKAVSDK